MSADVVVATHRAAGAISILIGMNMGPSPAQFAALAQAEGRLVQAAHKRDAAHWVLRNAKQALTQADQGRQRATRAFAALCRAEAEDAQHCMPAKPRWRVEVAEISAAAEALAALASVAAGDLAHPVMDAALEAFADPNDLEPSGEMWRAGAP